MDREKFLDLLKNLQSIMKCPACGALYNVEEIQFVSSQDGYFLLSLNCSKCSLPVWVNFFAGGVGNKKIISDLSIADFELAEREPITANEVVDFHGFISHFNGNFKRYIGKWV